MAALHLSIHRAITLFLNLCFLFLLYSSPRSVFLIKNTSNGSLNPKTVYYQMLLASDFGCCNGLHKFQENHEKCSYVKSHEGCQPGGYISYLYFFYCTPNSLALNYTLLLLWLVLLFYLLGDTAAIYFCSSLEGLSKTLNLPPTIAGVTLLSLGNGAPDVFASVASFMEDSTNEIGISSILGGAFFVSCSVVGIISLCVRETRIPVDRFSFMRDVLFLLISLLCFLGIVTFGKINFWGATALLLLYFVYVFMVSTSEYLCRKERAGEVSCTPVHDTSDIEAPFGFKVHPLNCTAQNGEYFPVGITPTPRAFSELEAPSLVSTTYQDDLHSGEQECGRRCWVFVKKLVLCIMELPLQLPRRLTIPVISEEKWSKPYAVASATLAPILLGLIWSSHGPNLPTCVLVGGSVGAVLGVWAFLTNDGSGPPRKCLFPWLAGGFLMSITWTYILAQELVSLLVSIGLVMGISPSILGLTVLAWGNSLGDLVANVTMARNGGRHGAQVAISGCYAGPIFNTLVGLGLSLAFSSWAVYPSYYLIPLDNTSVYETLGFLIGSLLWALLVLPKNKMRLNRILGVGLLVIYFCFLFMKLARTIKKC